MLADICKQAMKEGQKIDLSGCVYGKPKDTDKPSNYYYFLAGLVKTQRLTNILDLGTKNGGSIMSMSRGIHGQGRVRNRLVTVDIEYLNKEKLEKYPNIQRIQGDVLSKRVLKKTVESFDREIDLMFIDTLHEYKHVQRIITLYANKLKPKYIIFDDIHLNYSMEKLWRRLTKEFRDKAFDLTEIIGREAGFGIILWDRAYKLNWLKILVDFLTIRIVLTLRMTVNLIKRIIRKLKKLLGK